MNSQVALLGVSAAMRAVEQDLDCAAQTTAKILITGESGTGKEVVARLVHQRSRRHAAPLVAINCAGIPDALLESELFGHAKGSFTDAYRDTAGLLERAHGGTVFLDEVAEMSLRMQALLLRFLESGEVQRVGTSHAGRPVDVRVIAATHSRLVDRIPLRLFREDLYYRLNVIHIELPPLRERPEDVVVLATHFLATAAAASGVAPPTLTERARRRLADYAWPGNVRELRNVAERLVLRHASGIVDVDALPEDIRCGASAPATRQEDTAPRPQRLFERITAEGGSFWSVAYDPFMSRDLTREDIRELVRLGLQQTRGSYQLLESTFHMKAGEYKKFVDFLRKYRCHGPLQEFRMAKAQPRSGPSPWKASA